MTKQAVTATLVLCLTLFSACAEKAPTNTEEVRSAVIGVVTISSLGEGMKIFTPASRSAALLGVFVSEYLSVVPAAVAAESGLLGIQAQTQIMLRQETVDDPDFELLQAFADALQVDVPDLLNRSMDRQQQLQILTESLANIGARVNDRYKELSSVHEVLETKARQQKRDLSDAERLLNTAIRNKDFSSAGELQRSLNERQAAFADTDLQKTQTAEMLSTMDRLLTLYGEKIGAIEANREALISGTKVVDVPGIEELDILERSKRSRSRSGDSKFDALFEGTNAL